MSVSFGGVDARIEETRRLVEVSRRAVEQSAKLVEQARAGIAYDWAERERIKQALDEAAARAISAPRW